MAAQVRMLTRRVAELDSKLQKDIVHVPKILLQGSYVDGSRAGRDYDQHMDYQKYMQNANANGDNEQGMDYQKYMQDASANGDNEQDMDYQKYMQNASASDSGDLRNFLTVTEWGRLSETNRFNQSLAQEWLDDI